MEECNPSRKRKVLTVFDDMIAGMETNTKLSPIVIELFLRGRKLNILLVFISQSYFKVPKTIRLNTTHYFIIIIRNKRERQQIILTHPSDIVSKHFMKLYKDYNKDTVFISSERYNFAIR